LIFPAWRLLKFFGNGMNGTNTLRTSASKLQRSALLFSSGANEFSGKTAGRCNFVSKKAPESRNL